MINILEIKGTVPGAGKTTNLVKAFVKAKLPNKIILTPTNKARQVCMLKLVCEHGWDYNKAKKSVATMKSFCRNYVKLVEKDENGEIKVVKEYITSTGKKRKHFQQKLYNIFVDEASMLSQFDFDVLFKTVKIQNLVTSGDTLQFKPIECSFGIYDADEKAVITKDDVVLETYKTAVLPHFENSKQILLTKSHRAKDPRLVRALEMIKQGEVADAIEYIMEVHPPKEECENLSTDWHIAYTNNRVDHLNQMYENAPKKRYIVTKHDKPKEIYKGTIFVEGSVELEDLKRRLYYDNLKKGTEGSTEYTLQNWLDDHTKLAFALTCHKLQGSTLNEGDIYIHLDDFGLLMEAFPDTFVETFQRYIYVAVSRASSIEQINIYGSVGDARVIVDAEFEKMTADDIKEDAVKAETLEETTKWILENLDYSEWKRTEEEDYEEWRAKSYGKRKERADIGGKHKAKEYDPAEIEFAKTHSWPEAREKGWSNTKYYKYRKL